MFSKQFIRIGAAISLAMHAIDASTSHIHLRIHSSMYVQECNGENDSPMSVEGIEGIFCVTGPACVANYADGACPCADPEHGLPLGSYCGQVKTGVYGCKPCNEGQPCDDKGYLYLEDKYNEENPMDCTYKKVPVPTWYDTPAPSKDSYTPEPTQDNSYTPEPSKDDSYTPEPSEYDATPSPSKPDDYGSESCDWAENGYPTVTYTYNGDDTGNIKGTIVVEYIEKTYAKIKADLDFSGVKQEDLTAADGNCSSGATEYKWHIHVKWSSDSPYGSLQQCSGAATGGHFDPTKACGPASEYAGTEECLAKVASYSCTPETYSKDPLNCEEGDLGGKLGALKLDEYKKVVMEWEDKNFPSFDDYSPSWNILFHPSCANKAAPRFVCAQGMLENDPADYGC